MFSFIIINCYKFIMDIDKKKNLKHNIMHICRTNQNYRPKL